MSKTFDSLVKNLSHTDPSKRQAAAKSLGLSKDPRAVETLIALLDDPDESIRDQAADSLVALNDEKAILPLIACFIDPKRKSIPDIDGHESMHIPAAIKHFGPKASVYLLPYLQNSLDAWQKNVLWLFGEIADPSTVDALIEAFNKTDEGVVRYSIKEALKKINSGAARAFIGSLKKRW
jgi:HEAT repeat protein